MRVIVDPSDCQVCLNLENGSIGLTSNKFLYPYGSGSGVSLFCCDRSGSVIWVKKSLSGCDFWQSNDSFVDVVDSFYLKPGDKGYKYGENNLYKRQGKVRVITFQGFSYEIDVNTGSAEYFDFHK